MPTLSMFYGIVIQMFWQENRGRTSTPCMQSMRH